MTYKVGGITLPHGPFMVGAGACKTPHSTFEWLSVAPVVSGSYTPKAREGNKGERLFYPDTFEKFLKLGCGLNAFGMPNMGFAAAARQFELYSGEQPLIVSIAGFSVDDYVEGVRTFNAVESVQAIECNFGCPNTECHEILSFDLGSLGLLFKKLEGRTDKPIWVKFSPFSDPGMLKKVVRLVNGSSAIRAVVTCNTFANAHMGKGKITPNNGFAGLSGPILKPITFGQVIQFRGELESHVDVISSGGVAIGNDVVDFLEAGASAVQLTSVPFWMGKPDGFLDYMIHPDTGSRLEDYLNL